MYYANLSERRTSVRLHSLSDCYEYNGTAERMSHPRIGQISTHVEAVNLLLKWCPTHSNTANETSEIAAMKMIAMETSLTFADALRTKLVC